MTAKSKGKWMPQTNPADTRCNHCRRTISKWVLYWRLVFDPDGRDPRGFDQCATCHTDSKYLEPAF
jgi:hypothetical protein